MVGSTRRSFGAERRRHVARPSRGAAAALVGAGLSTLALTACATSSTLSLEELLADAPPEEVVVEGAVYATSTEFFGPEGAEWVYDVYLCEGVTLRGSSEWAECTGESLELPEQVAWQDFDWEYVGIADQYLEKAELRGRLVGDRFEVVAIDDQSVPSTTTSSSTTDTTEPPLPIEELAGEDLYGLRTYVRSTEVLYLASEDFVGRVRQLRANCETAERLQLILDNMSRRGSEAPQDYVEQQSYVCPDLVAGLQVFDGVRLPSS